LKREAKKSTEYIVVNFPWHITKNEKGGVCGRSLMLLLEISPINALAHAHGQKSKISIKYSRCMQKLKTEIIE
jgi:histone H3/H4